MLSAADADLVRRDPLLPGLRLVLDSRALADELRPWLDIRETVAATYLRYKPSTSCLAAYRVRLADSDKCLDIYARAYREDSPEKLRSKRDGVIVPAPFVFTGSNVVVARFPYDRRLKQLHRLGYPSARRALLSRLFFQQPDWSEAGIVSLRYKPERRYVGQLLLDGRPAAVVKLYNPGEYRSVRAGSKHLRSGDLLRVPQWLGRSKRYSAAAFEWLPGRVLGWLMRQPRFSLRPLDHVGQALAELHAQHNAEARRIQPRETARNLRAVAASLEQLCPQLSGRASALADRLASVLEHFPQRNRAIHGDFHPGQVVLQFDRVGIVDFDAAGQGDPASDLGNFLAHLHWEALNGNCAADQLSSMVESLCAGYGDEAVVDRAAVYVAAGLLRLAPHAFRRRASHWADQIEATVERAWDVCPVLQQRLPDFTLPGGQPKGGKPAQAEIVDPYGVLADPRMSFLSAALDPRFAAQRLTPLLLRIGELNPPVQLEAIRVIRYKPGRRCLIEYDFVARDQRRGIVQATLLGKVRAKGLDTRMYRLLGDLWLSGFHDQSVDEISIPQPIGAVAEWHMWLQRKINGTTATRLLAEAGGPGICRRIADAIHKLHQAVVATPRHHSLDDELRILQHRLSLVAQQQQFDQRLLRVLQVCQGMAAHAARGATRLIHRDFYPDQVLLAGSRVYLIDFDLFCQGDPALDIGNFCGHLTEQALRTAGGADALALCEQALNDRYCELAGPQTRATAQMYSTLTLVRHIYLSTQFPDRRHLTGPLLELCEARLGLR
jgi:aminoglycoside phosphotransferase (APT) family kinase protein